MRRRRLLVPVSLLLAVAIGGGPAVAVEDDSLDLRLEKRSERAAAGDGPGAAHLRADSAEEGVVRRTVRLDDVEHLAAATPSQRLAAVDVAIDLEAQTMSAAVSLGAAPDPAAPVVVVLGTWNGSSCTPVFGVQAAGGGAVAQFMGAAAAPATATVQGNLLTISAPADGRHRTTLYECAFAHVVDPANASNALSVAYAESLTDIYRPVLEVVPDDRMVGAKKGRWARVSLEVNNTSQGPATGVRLTATGAGIEIRTPTIEIGAMDDRSTEYVDLDVRLEQPKGKKGKKAKAPKPRTLTLTATDPGAATATATTVVVQSPKPTTPKKLTGTYWWGWESTNLQSRAGWINHSIWFVDARWAYTGWAEGKKPRCSASVKDCQRYSYNARTGKLTLGKQRAKVTSEGFTVKHPAYGDEKLRLEPLALPKKGSKLAVDLYHQNWSGYCAITCTSYTDYLTMDASGKFVEGGFSVGSWPGLGQSWSSAPADQRGTYKVVSTGIIEMSYADGTRKRQVIGIQHDPSGKPNPAAAGVVLGDVNFYD